MYVLRGLSKYIHPHYNDAEVICSIIAKVELKWQIFHSKWMLFAIIEEITSVLFYLLISVYKLNSTPIYPKYKIM